MDVVQTMDKHSSDPLSKETRLFGKDHVVAVVIEAAADLFSSKGFDGVSIREIAKQAGVNHGLIHRHFGSKDNLRRQTLQHMADAMLADVKDAPTFHDLSLQAFQSLVKHGRFWRILARTILDGHGTKDIHRRYPIARYMIDRLKEAIDEGSLRSSLDPKLIVATMFSFSCGFTLFEPFILSAVELDTIKPEDARKAVFNAAMALVSDTILP